jgi:hypothetical protein
MVYTYGLTVSLTVVGLGGICHKLTILLFTNLGS